MSAVITGSQDAIRISFIIPVLNGDAFIGICLDHIVREKEDQDEVIVVDNGSTDRTMSIISKFSGVRIIQRSDVTIAALRNLGAAVSKGDVLAFIDCDVLIQENWRKNVLGAVSDPKVGATGSKCDIPPYASWVERAWYSMKTRGIKPVRHINSGNLIVRRRVFEQLSGFNERLITDEDSDIEMRLIDHGYALMDVPGIRAIHLGNPKTIGQFYRQAKWHATGGFKLQIGRRIDRTMIMTLLFWLSALAAVVLLPLTLMHVLGAVPLCIVVLLAPFAATVYRVYQYRNYTFFFHLLILYFIIFWAKTVRAGEMLVGRNSLMYLGRRWRG